MKPDYRRTTITVPVILKERMKKARAHVNWSAVACDAFEKKLEELGPIEEVTSIDGALKRLKSLKGNSSSENDPNPDGIQAGKHWAMNFATPDQLERIEAFRNEMSKSEWQELMTSTDGFRELAKCIAPKRGHRPPPKRRRPGRPGPARRGEGWQDIAHHDMGWERDIWRSILDRRPDSPAFFLGFAEGALEIWKQIKDQL